MARKGSLASLVSLALVFNSAFMVADSVDVVTRKAGDDQSWLWSSDGKGQFSIEPAEKDECGTTVILHLKKDGRFKAVFCFLRRHIASAADIVPSSNLIGELKALGIANTALKIKAHLHMVIGLASQLRDISNRNIQGGRKSNSNR